MGASKYCNYQLYRTNILLSGQVQWDLVLDDTGSNLVVSNFQLSPVSEYIPYTDYVSENLLGYTHASNLMNFYKTTSGTFFNPLVKPGLDDIHPIIVDGDKYYDTHDDTYEMGCRRARYSKYNKQLRFLCPLWLEHIDKDISLYITISRNGTELTTRKLTLANIGDNKYHNKFVEYFKEYLNSNGLDVGNNDIISVRFKNNGSYIKGISVETGKIRTKRLTDLAYNLLYRERPLMEFDNLIINEFKDNNMICAQLINLCLYFNPEDVMSDFVNKELLGKDLCYSIRVAIGDEILDIADFYSNYEYIPKKRHGSMGEISYDADNRKNDIKIRKESDAPNVLDYMSDNKYYKYSTVNKLSQNIIHWSLYDNNDYIFNIYDGFAGYDRDEEGNIIKYTHAYDDTPDINITSYSNGNNTLGWCNNFEISNISDLDKIIFNLLRTNDNDKYFSSFTITESNWVNNIKYTPNTSRHEDTRPFEVMLIPIDGTLDDIYMTGVNHIDLGGPVLYYINGFRKFVFVGTKKDLTYIKILNCLLKISDTYDIVKDFVYILRSAQKSGYPMVITPETSLQLSHAHSPDLSSTEIDYYKDNATKGTYVLRYDGRIKPTFITTKDDINFNYVYSKKYLSETQYLTSPFKRYYDSGMQPRYPSIGFCAFEGHEFGYEGHEFDFNKNLKSQQEYHLFNDSRYYNINPYIEFTVTTGEQKDSERVIEIDKRLDDEIYKLYGYDKDTEEHKYIKSLYSYTQKQYMDVVIVIDGMTKTFTYIYDIKLKLK